MPGSVLVFGNMGVIQTWVLFSVASQKSPSPSALLPPPSAQLQPGGLLGVVPLGDSPLPLGLAEGSSLWRAVTRRPAVRPVSAGE